MTNSQNLVAINGDKITTTSIKVALTFKKAHRHVLDKIKQLEAETSELVGVPKNRQTYFIQSEVNDIQGKPQPCYELTRDGFTLLAMGFTGKKALQFKLAYIDAFNKMEEALRGQTALVKSHTRRLPVVRTKKELVLSDKEHSAIGGIVKRCVAVALKEQLPQVLPAAKPKKEAPTKKEMYEFIARHTYLSVPEIIERASSIAGYLAGLAMYKNAKEEEIDELEENREYLRKLAVKMAKTL